GSWGGSDDTRGVHKAPANEVVRGAITLEIQITKSEHDLLNPHGINCIRAFPGRGIRVWGARTISSDPSWRYINIRRLFNYLEESTLAATKWPGCTPNTPASWPKPPRPSSSCRFKGCLKGRCFASRPPQAYSRNSDASPTP